jgi:hypothetical protein
MKETSWNAKAVEKQQLDTHDVPKWMFDAYAGRRQPPKEATKLDKKD